MMSGLRKALVPGAAVFLGCVVYLAFDETGRIPAALGPTQAAKTYGLVIYGAGLALAWVFHRSRPFAALTLLAAVDIAVTNSERLSHLDFELTTVILVLLGVLSLVRDRGVMSRLGSAQVFLAAVFVALVAWFFTDSEQVALVLAGPQIRPLAAARFGLPLLAWGAVGFTAMTVAWGLFRYRGPVERSFAWAALFIFVAMHPGLQAALGPGDAAKALFLVAAGLTIAAGVVETSYVMAYRDELTGLPGRRALTQYLDEIQGTYTVAMVDVDHFKRFNDRHGHDVGDQVLRLVATLLARTEGGGKVYRYGGEEFMLLYPGRTQEEVLPRLEDLRRSIEEARFSIRSWRRPRNKPEEATSKPDGSRRPRRLSVTVSIGVADTTGEDSTLSAVLTSADEALYRAKKNGRNQVCL